VGGVHIVPVALRHLPEFLSEPRVFSSDLPEQGTITAPERLVRHPPDNDPVGNGDGDSDNGSFV